LSVCGGRGALDAIHTTRLAAGRYHLAHSHRGVASWPTPFDASCCGSLGGGGS
jgi:hypothetical protein